MDEARRRECARLHSAGHALDEAMRILGFSLVPTKGYHFADGAACRGLGRNGRVLVE